MDKESVNKKVIEKIEACMSVLYYDATICEDSHLVNDLGFDSITLMQLVVELEELFQIEMDDVEYENIVMVSKLVEYIFEKTNRTEGHEEII